MSGPYDDIINLPHHVSATRPQMSIANRAAQFSPFAALTGYDSAIKETARLTSDRMELSESDIAVLDMKLQILKDSFSDFPEVEVTYFKPDEKKKGGAYVSSSGTLKRIDDFENAVIFMDGSKIPIHDIIDISCELFVCIE